MIQLQIPMYKRAESLASFLATITTSIVGHIVYITFPYAAEQRGIWSMAPGMVILHSNGSLKQGGLSVCGFQVHWQIECSWSPRAHISLFVVLLNVAGIDIYNHEELQVCFVVELSNGS